MTDNTINNKLNASADFINKGLYDFNQNYILYISQCTGNNAKQATSSVCASLYGNLITYQTNVNQLPDEYHTYNTPLSIQGLYDGANFLPAGSLTTNDQHDNIMKEYDNVTKKRTDLDAKLKELYDIPGSKSLDYKYNYDSTVYSGILLTIIASGVIYYTFTKL